MTSKVTIANMALARLGSGASTRIVSLETDNTLAANTVNLLFDTVVDRVAMQGAWTSTVRRAALAMTATTPIFGYAHTFQLPVDPFCLKVLNIEDGSEFVVEGDKLLTDASTVNIRYIARLTNPEDFDTMLCEAVETLLAAYLAQIVTGNKDAAIALEKRYMALVDINLGLNNQQGSVVVIPSDDLKRDR
jgi:hypothetical protein